MVLKHNTQFNLVLILGKKIWKRKHLLIKKALLSIATEVLYAVYLRTAIMRTIIAVFLLSKSISDHVKFPA